MSLPDDKAQAPRQPPDPDDTGDVCVGCGLTTESTVCPRCGHCQVCQDPGHWNSGVPGILARMENGQVVPNTQVQRCDSCERYESDTEALKKLIELGKYQQMDQTLQKMLREGDAMLTLNMPVGIAFTVFSAILLALRHPEMDQVQHVEACLNHVLKVLGEEISKSSEVYARQVVQSLENHHRMLAKERN